LVNIYFLIKAAKIAYRTLSVQQQRKVKKKATLLRSAEVLLNQEILRCL